MTVSILKGKQIYFNGPLPDHVINNTELFLNDIKYAIDNYEKEKLTVFGIVPSRVETGYGYINVVEKKW